MTTHNLSTTTPGAFPRRRMPATQRSLRGSLLGTIFTPTGFIAKDFAVRAPSTTRPIAIVKIPGEAVEQQRMLEGLRDALVENKASTLEAVGLAALVARAACIHAKRPIRADVVAAALRVTSSLAKAVLACRPGLGPSRRSHFQMERLGWSGVGPEHPHVLFEAYADAIQERAPYVSNETAVAAATLCFEEVGLCGWHRIDLNAFFEQTRSDLLLMLAPALVLRPVPPHGLTFLSSHRPMARQARSGAASVTLRLARDAVAVVDLAQPPGPCEMTGKAFWSLCAALLCGDAELAASGAEVRLNRVDGSVDHRLVAPGLDCCLSPAAVNHLQQAVIQLLSDGEVRARVRAMEQTCGVL
jgi:hypothetical protein